MKKTTFIVITAFFCCTLFSNSYVFAGLRDDIKERPRQEIIVPENISEKIGEGKAIIFEEIDKESAIILVDNLITAINKIENKVLNSPIPDDVKTNVITTFDEVKVYLESAKNSLENAESIEEVKEVFTDMKNNLKSYSAEIKKCLQEMKESMGEISAEQLEKAINEIKKALKILKVACPAQSESIETIEKNIDELEKLLIEINECLISEDYIKIQQVIFDSKDLLQSTANAVGVVLVECEIPTR